MKKVTFVFDRGASVALKETRELSVLLPIAFEGIGLIIQSSNTLVHEEELGHFAAGNLNKFVIPTGPYHFDLVADMRESSRIQAVFGLFPDTKNMPNYLKSVLGVRLYFYTGRKEIASYHCSVCREFSFSIGGFTAR